MDSLIPEPHEGDGGLLRGAHEAVRGAEDGAAHPQRTRLHRLHAHALPELTAPLARAVLPNFILALN